MRVFTCQNCGQLLHFENTVCMRCGYDARASCRRDADALGADARAGRRRWPAMADGGAGSGAATPHAARCNWMVPADEPTPSARPAAQPHHPRPRRARERGALAGAGGGEAAAGLCAEAPRPAAGRAGRRTRTRGLAFDFLADAEPSAAGDDRPRRRAHHHQHRRGGFRRARAAAGGAGRALPHPARPPAPRGRPLLLGRAGARRRQDRGGARRLRRRERGLPARRWSGTTRTARRADWQASFVSAYATMHPWEDFAETWTHYLHMVDTLDTAASFGLAVDPGVSDDPTLETEIAFDPYRAPQLRPAGRGLAAADRGGQQPQPQHGPARPLPLRAEPAGRSRSCASSTGWCTRRGVSRGAAFARPGAVPECRRPGDAAHGRGQPSPPISAATARRPSAEAEGATVREVLDAGVRRATRCCAPTSSTTRGGCAGTSTSSSAGG